MAATSEGIALAVAPLRATCKARVVGHMSCDAFAALLSSASLGFAPRSGAAKFCPKCVFWCVFGSISPCFCVFVFWAGRRCCVFVFSCFGASPRNTRPGGRIQHPENNVEAVKDSFKNALAAGGLKWHKVENRLNAAGKPTNKVHRRKQPALMSWSGRCPREMFKFI